jgi:tetratricopeptide (TPR) repeat protein
VDREREKLAIQVARHVRAGAYAKALPEMDRLVQLEPHDMRLRLELADLCLRNGDKARAVDELVHAARRYEKDGLGLKAMGCYLQVTRIDPSHREVALALGRHYTEHGLFREASLAYARALEAAKDQAIRLQTIASILESDQDNLVDRIRLAEAMSAQGLLQDAARELRKVLEVFEGKAADHDYPRVAERLLYHQNDDPSVAKRLAALCVASDEPQRALPRLKKAYESKPEDLELLHLLADTFERLGQVHKAVAVLKEMVRIYDAGGLQHERDECWTRVLRLEPNDPQARAAMGASSPGPEEQTFEVPYHPGPAVHQPSALATPVLKPATVKSDFDDLDDFDSDEIGFGGAAETTLVDDKFVPEEVLSQAAAALELNAAPASGLQEDLRELDFYIANGLRAEADALVRTLGARYGANNPLIDRRAQQVASMR